MSPTRRELLKQGWYVGGGLLAGSAAWTSFEALAPLAEVEGSGTVLLQSPDAYLEGSATFVRSGHLYVTRARGELFAVSQKCPHLGCGIPYCGSSGRFECPCHGSQFDLAGEHLSGPSPRGMDRHPIAVRDGRVVVDASVLIEGPPLGDRRYETPSLGARCSSGTTGAS
jgi:Rieske Fe-S protein